MGIHKDSMEFLSQIYEICIKQGSYQIERSTYMDLSKENRQYLEQCFNYLKQKGYIQNYAPCAGFPISVEMTPDGIQVVEKICPTPSTAAVTNIVYGDNYGITGNNAVGNTISNIATFDDIRSLISSKVDEDDQQKLLDALKPLYDRLDIGAPIEKGMLSTISENLEKYQTVLGAVLSSVTAFLTAPK